MSFEIKQGDALSVLKTLDSESVQCVITSPPYYGLRSYGTDPIVWGNHNGCSHQWGEQLKYTKQDPRSAEKKREQGAAVGGSITFCDITTNGNSGNFCLSCNAWRGELGLEPTFQLYISRLIEIFAEVKRVLKKDGTCFVNLGDSFSGDKSGNTNGTGAGGVSTGKVQQKDGVTDQAFRKRSSDTVRAKSLMNIPARFAIAMTDELQMIQRNELVWHKPACMPSSATDRWTVDFEPIYFFAKSPKYKFNQQFERATQEYAEQGRLRNPDKVAGIGYEIRAGLHCQQGKEYRNARTVRTVNFEPQSDEHYASYPTKLVEPFILAGTDEGDTVFDIFAGTGTTLLTALRHRRNALGIELQPKYIEIANKRLSEVQVNLF